MSDQNICRLCMKLSSKTFRIFSSDIPVLIEALTCIKVKEDDGLPTVSCEDCVSDVRNACAVKNRIIESDRKLRNDIAVFSNQVTETTNDNTPKVFANQKLAIENVSHSSQNIEDDVVSGHSNCDDARDGSSDEGDNAVDGVMLIVKEEEMKHSCERKIEEHEEEIKESCKDVKRKPVKTKSHLKKTRKKVDKSGNSVKEEAEKGEDTSDSDSKKQKEEASKDYVIIPEAPDIIHVDTSGGRGKWKYSCVLCKIKLEQRDAYIHKSKHIKAKCNLCGLITRADNMRKHLSMHKSEIRICDICGSSHKGSEGLRAHMRYSHSKRPPSKCKHCSEEFKNNTHLEEHVRRFHTGVRPYQCDLCGKTFITSSILKKHKELVHQHLRPYPCEYCQKSFSSRYALTTHRRQHTGELPYTCDLCPEGFRQLVSLRTHMKSKHNIIMKANKPGYTYARQLKKELKKELMNI